MIGFVSKFQTARQLYVDLVNLFVQFQVNLSFTHMIVICSWASLNVNPISHLLIVPSGGLPLLQFIIRKLAKILQFKLQNSLL